MNPPIFRLLTAIILMVPFLMLLACGQSERSVVNSISPAKEIEVTSDGDNILMLGDVVYGFDFVACIPGPVATLIASDRQKRSMYPVVRVSVYESAMAGGPIENTVSVDFTGVKPRILWLLHEGVVEKTQYGFVASGALHGQAMVDTQAGIARPEPLGDGQIRSFQLNVSC